MTNPRSNSPPAITRRRKIEFYRRLPSESSVACGCLPLPCSRARSTRHRSTKTSAPSGGHEEDGINGSGLGPAQATSTSGAGSRKVKARLKSKSRAEEGSVTSVSLSGAGAGTRRGTATSTVSATSSSSVFQSSPKDRRKLIGLHHHHHHGGGLQRKGGVYDRGQAGEPDPDPPHLKASPAVQARSIQPRVSRRPVIRSAKHLLGSCKFCHNRRLYPTNMPRYLRESSIVFSTLGIF